MISNILNGKLTSSYQSKKLVSLEDCYKQLKPYFKIKISGQVNASGSALKGKKFKVLEINFHLILLNRIK